MQYIRDSEAGQYLVKQRGRLAFMATMEVPQKKKGEMSSASAAARCSAEPVLASWYAALLLLLLLPLLLLLLLLLPLLLLLLLLLPLLLSSMEHVTSMPVPMQDIDSRLASPLLPLLLLLGSPFLVVSCCRTPACKHVLACTLPVPFAWHHGRTSKGHPGHRRNPPQRAQELCQSRSMCSDLQTCWYWASLSSALSLAASCGLLAGAMP